MSKKLQKSSEYAPVFNRLIDICDCRNISVSQLLDNFATSRSAIGAWKKGNINAETIGKIADYLSVSTEYLIYGEETNKPAINMSHSVGANLYGTVTIGTDSVEVKENSDSCIKGLDGEALKIFHRLPLKEQYRLLAVMCDFEEEYLKKLNE